MSLARVFRCILLACLTLTPFAGAQTSVQIHDIMVAGNNPVVGTAATKTLPYSPYYGVNVSVTGIVVGVETSGDYAGTVYISEPSSSWDSVILTAEGMPVFNMATVNSACAVVGANVTVVGTVVLSTAVVSADVTAANTPGTGILPTSCTTTTTGTMTQSISVNSVLTAPRNFVQVEGGMFGYGRAVLASRKRSGGATYSTGARYRTMTVPGSIPTTTSSLTAWSPTARALSRADSV